MKNNDLKKIEIDAVQRYSQRLKEHGNSPKSLGWGSVNDQLIRFNQTISSNIDFSNKSIIDIGCGFGDYLAFLLDKTIDFNKYLGIDINQELIDIATNKFEYEKNITFKVFNMLEHSLEQKPIADIGVMIGLLNFKLDNQTANYMYSKLMIERAFSLVSNYLIVDFLSASKNKLYKNENWTFHHELPFVINLASSLTNNFIIKHDYPEIPQKEFMIILKKP